MYGLDRISFCYLDQEQPRTRAFPDTDLLPGPGLCWPWVGTTNRTQILADEIDRIANLETPVEIVVSKEQLPILITALRGKREAMALFRESVPDLSEIMDSLTTEAAA